MNDDQTTTDYRSSDLALVACLAISVPIEEIDRTDPKRAVFVFQDTDGVTELVGRYWAGKVRVEPRAYFEKLREIKSRIYSEQRI